jgi:ABC-type oligopeptide transport system substrate-binding subunit
VNFYDLSVSFEEPIERLKDSGKDAASGRFVVDVDFYEDYEIMVVAYTSGGIDTYQINSAYKNSEFYLDKVYCN